MSCITLACYVGLEVPLSTVASLNDQVDKTHIHCFVFREHSIKVTQELQELFGGLDSVSEGTKGYMKCLHLSYTVRITVCAHVREASTSGLIDYIQEI